MLNIFFKKPFEFTVLISAFFCTFHSPDLSAQTAPRQVTAVAFAPYHVWSEQLKNQIQNSAVELNQEIGVYQYTSPDGSIQFVSERATLSSAFQAQLTSSAQDNSVQANLQLNAARVLISNFNLEAVIKKDLGFGTATLKLDMHCDSIELNLKNTQPVSAQVTVDKGQFSVSQLAWDLSKTQIETKLNGCKEVAGFDQLLRDQIQQNLEQSFVVQALQQMINERINGAVNQKISEELAKYVLKFQIALDQKHEFDEQNNLWIFSGNKPIETFTADEIQNVKKSSQAVLLIKKQSLETLAKDSLNDFLKSQAISSKNIDGISRLTCSRFLQFFVWPSLRSLSKCFEMQIQTQVQSLSITDLKTLSLDIKVGSWASGEGHQIAYFESVLSGRLQDLSVRLNSFKGQSDPDFIKWSGKSKRIATSLIERPVGNLLDTTVAKLKENEVFKMIQKNTSMKVLSTETIMIEISL